MNTGIVIIVCFLCFLVGFIFNETIRSKESDKNKIPFKEDMK